MVDSSQSRLSYIAETVEGTTPATPAFKNIRFTDENFKPAIQYTTSNEIRPDRNVPDLTPVSSNAGGSFGIELSYGSFDDFLEALLCGTWASNVLINGTATKAFTIEKTFEAGTTDQYHRYSGARVNTLSLNVRASEMVTGSFGLLARGMTSAQAIIAGATYTAANTNPVINATSNFAALVMTGVTSPAIMGLKIDITNNLRQQPVVGSLSSKGIGTGRFVVTGEIEAYFENAQMLDMYIGNTATDLTFELGGASTQKYQIKIPKLKFSDAEIIAGGNDQDVMCKMPFQAIFDSTTVASIKITRTP